MGAGASIPGRRVKVNVKTRTQRTGLSEFADPRTGIVDPRVRINEGKSFLESLRAFFCKPRIPKRAPRPVFGRITTGQRLDMELCLIEAQQRVAQARGAELAEAEQRRAAQEEEAARLRADWLSRKRTLRAEWNRDLDQENLSPSSSFDGSLSTLTDVSSSSSSSATSSASSSPKKSPSPLTRRVSVLVDAANRVERVGTAELTALENALNAGL